MNECVFVSLSHPEGTVGGRLLGRLTTEEAPAPMLVGRGHARNLSRRFRDMHSTSTRPVRFEAGS